MLAPLQGPRSGVAIRRSRWFRGACCCSENIGPDDLPISGLNNAALIFAVYAS